jgi:uncharacterized membrane protein YfcA
MGDADMELTVSTILIAFAGVFLICFMKGAFGGGFSIVGIPLLSFVMDPVTAGGLLAPLFIAMDLFALRYWKPSTWSKPDLVLLLPGLVIGIGFGYLLFRVLDHRAVAIVMAVVTLIFVGLWFFGDPKVTISPRSTPKAVAAGLASGVTTMVAHSGGPPLAMYLLPLGLTKEVYAGTTSLFFTVGNATKGGAMAVTDAAKRQRIYRDGDLPLRHSHRRLARLAPARAAGPAADFSRLLRLAGGNRAQAALGRRVRLSRLRPCRRRMVCAAGLPASR